MSDAASEILTSLDRGVLTITLNRPDRMNAWNRVMETKYFDALDAADENPDVRVIIVTGAGRGFCPGMDSQSLEKAATAGQSVADRRPMTHALSIRKPLIAAVNGACAGIGLVQALVCDIRFATAGAKLATSFTRRGLHAEFSTSWLLPRLVGYGNANDLLISGRAVVAEEAQQLGLVNRVYPGEELLAQATAYARDLADNCAPVSMAMVKQQISDDWTRSQVESFDYAATLFDAPGRIIDFREGITSFVEKRPPAFRPLPPRQMPLDQWNP